MELERRYAGLSKRKGKAVSQITLETDLNVPDQKPDIFCIVHKQGEFRPDEVKCESGKVKIRGIFLYRILYISEGMDRTPESLEGSIPVDEIIFLNDLEDGDTLDFRWTMEDLHASMIHSRKANIKCILTLMAEAWKEQPVPLVTCPKEEAGTYIKCCPAEIQQEVLHKKDTLRIREEMNLPPGRPNIQRILWKEIRLQGADVRLEEGKLLVKGELIVFLLYLCEEGRLQWMEQGIPFRQEVECDVCNSDLTGQTEIRLLRADLEMQPDYDGEPRMIRVDAVLEMLIRYLENSVEEVICDAYSQNSEVKAMRKSYQWDAVTGVSDSRARAGGRMKLTDTDPKMLQILNSGAFLHLDHTEKNDRGLQIQGNIELWVLYATSNDGQPLACVSHTFPFDHTAELTGIRSDSEWQVYLGLDQLMVTMLDHQELEMKAVLQIQVLCTSPEQISLVEALEEMPLDKERLKKLPGMAIHVVQPGETLWDISKMYMTSEAAVCAMNELSDESLKIGQKVLLVKEVVR